jgi:dTDP-D-glucose 4,6-dehydratase
MNTTKKQTILITGGYGFIMSNMINYINERCYGVDIINIDKCGAGSNTLNILPPMHNNTIKNIHMKCEDSKFLKLLKV